MAKDIKVTIKVNLVPHPNPKAAIDLVAGIVVKQLLKDGYLT